MTAGTESDFEEATIQRLEQLGYTYAHGRTLARGYQEVVLENRLREQLQRRYHALPDRAIEQAIELITRPEGIDLAHRNMRFQDYVRGGVQVRYDDRVTGEARFAHVYPIDFDHPDLNDFLVVNQLTVQGPPRTGFGAGNTRRPDVVVYINGLPLVVFELKNPQDEYADVTGAHNQMGVYLNDIPQLFDYNGFCVVSDGNSTLHGMMGASFDWYAAWKSRDGVTIEQSTIGSMKTLIEGLFPKARLLDYLRNYIVHTVENEKIIKKGAKYHQYFAVNAALPRAVEALTGGAERRVGVIWHTQGSGKSLEMIFLTGILRRWAGLNPTIVIQVDRADLDNQLYKEFVGAQALVGDVKQAESVANLRDLLQNESGDLICTTLEKFQAGKEEETHPVLSERRNILVIADEAHRTQYNLLTGFAAHLRNALPNAAFLGFTGTPVDSTDANTIQIFGEHIHVYDMKQARDDNAVVPIYYEARHIPLGLDNITIDEDLAGILQEVDTPIGGSELEEAKRKWSILAQAAGTRERVAKVAADLLAHFNERQAQLRGKAMAVCMTRANCVALYDALTALPDCPQVQIVMTSDIARDPKAWSDAGHVTTKQSREDIKRRFKDPADPLKIVIVCDMWLTGFDAPVVNTLYVDKRMQGHNLMQAIARVNRIFEDKPGGLIVDYIGISEQLQAATAKYSKGGGRGKVLDDLATEAFNLFLMELQVTASNLPPGQPYGAWLKLAPIAREDLFNLAYGTLAQDEARRDDFLQNEYRLTKAYSLVKHLPESRPYQGEVTFYQAVRKQLLKLQPAAKVKRETLQRRVRDLLDESVAAGVVVDIYASAGLERPDIGILDEKFLAGFRATEAQDLQARLLAKLLADEIARRAPHNIVRSRSFKELLEGTLKQYNEGAINAPALVQVLVKIRQDQLADEQRKRDLGLSDEELAFYDVLYHGLENGVAGNVQWVAALVRQIVQTIKSKLEVDWTQPHRADVRMGVQNAVRIVLMRNKISREQMGFLLNALLKQAEATYEEWPLAS